MVKPEMGKRYILIAGDADTIKVITTNIEDASLAAAYLGIGYREIGKHVTTNSSDDEIYWRGFFENSGIV